MSVAVPIALALIFLLLFFTFGSFKQSILIFTAIPLSAIGGVFALWIRGMPFSISAGVGFIALFGVAVLNGIVLIAEFNNLKKEGITNLIDIVKKGTHTRLRPVLMTALVASLGFLPMALSQGSGAEVQKPLATVVIGGLISATLLTLLVLPILYILFENRFKFKMNKTYIILLVFFFLNTTITKAQDIKSVSLDQAIDAAIQNNDGIKSAQYLVDYNESIKGTSSEIGKTNATWMHGQYNSYYKDNSISISQTIPLPIVMVRHAQYNNAMGKSAELNKHVSENELKSKVKSAYNSLQFTKAKKTLFQKQDSIYNIFLKFAELRLKTGESNTLEKATAESQLYENMTLIVQNDADILIYQNQLKTLLNTTEGMTSTNSVFEKFNDDFTYDSLSLTKNPMLHYLLQQIEIARIGKKVEQSKLLPELTFSYFNQTLYGTTNYRDENIESGANTRFQGVSVGLNFLIWAKPQLAKIKANDASFNMSEANYNLQQKNMQGMYYQALQEYVKFKRSLEYYEKFALKSAELITYTASRNYQSGNIGYMEFSQALIRAVNIQTGYLNLLQQYNQAIINIEFLLGNK